MSDSNLKRNLDATWEKVNGSYRCIVIKFISECVKLVANRTACRSMGLTRINSRSFVKPKFHKIDCDLNWLEQYLYIFFENSIPVSQIYIRCV